MASRKYKYLDNKVARAMAGAIIKNAVNDYMDALIQDDAALLADCESFFKSNDGWFDWLSNGLNGEEIMRIVRKKIETLIKACECHQPEKYGDKKAAKEASFTCPCCGSTPVTISYDRRNPAFRQCLQYTCSTCHISLRIVYGGSVLPRDFNCKNCGHCEIQGDDFGIFCRKHEKTMKRLVFDCEDWVRRNHEEVD